jgi:hypothetical protein
MVTLNPAAAAIAAGAQVKKNNNNNNKWTRISLMLTASPLLLFLIQHHTKRVLSVVLLVVFGWLAWHFLHAIGRRFGRWRTMFLAVLAVAGLLYLFRRAIGGYLGYIVSATVLVMIGVELWQRKVWEKALRLGDTLLTAGRSMSTTEQRVYAGNWVLGLALIWFEADELIPLLTFIFAVILLVSNTTSGGGCCRSLLTCCRRRL